MRPQSNPPPSGVALTRRQTQVMGALHRLGDATAAEVQSNLAAHGVELSYPAVKSALRGLVQERRATLRRRGRANRYRPSARHDDAARGSLRSWLRTFFSDAPGAALLAFLDEAGDDLSDAEVRALRDRLRRIEAAGSGTDARRDS